MKKFIRVMLLGFALSCVLSCKNQKKDTQTLLNQAEELSLISLYNELYSFVQKDTTYYFDTKKNSYQLKAESLNYLAESVYNFHIEHHVPILTDKEHPENYDNYFHYYALLLKDNGSLSEKRKKQYTDLSPHCAYCQYAFQKNADITWANGNVNFDDFPEFKNRIDSKAAYLNEEKKERDEKEAAEKKRRKELEAAEKRKRGLEMIKIPGKNFEMLKTEVTQGLYEFVMGENPSFYQFRDELKKDIRVPLQKVCGGDNSKLLPVESVSWYDAIVFCNKLSQMEGYKPVYSVNGTTDTSKWGYKPHKAESIKGKIVQDKNANGFRLPTNDEWEYAARGGRNFDYAGSYDLDDVGWWSGNSGGLPHLVAKKKPNGYGLYDMSGNVFEWVWDSGPGVPASRYGRGGCYYYGTYNCEVSCRSWYPDASDRLYEYLGFRLLRQTE